MEQRCDLTCGFDVNALSHTGAPQYSSKFSHWLTGWEIKPMRKLLIYVNIFSMLLINVTTRPAFSLSLTHTNTHGQTPTHSFYLPTVNIFTLFQCETTENIRFPLFGTRVSVSASLILLNFLRHVTEPHLSLPHPPLCIESSEVNPVQETPPSFRRTASHVSKMRKMRNSLLTSCTRTICIT